LISQPLIREGVKEEEKGIYGTSQGKGVK